MLLFFFQICYVNLSFIQICSVNLFFNLVNLFKIVNLSEISKFYKNDWASYRKKSCPDSSTLQNLKNH